MKKSQSARPAPTGRGRRTDWAGIGTTYDTGSRPQAAWLWQALAHWGADHGDPETGRQPRNAAVAQWIGVGPSSVSAWLGGRLSKAEWYEIVRDRVGCGPATCPSPYADAGELTRKHEAAVREAGQTRKPANGPAPRDDARPFKDEGRAALRRVTLADRRTVRAWEAVVPLLDDPDRAAVHLRDVFVTHTCRTSAAGWPPRGTTGRRADC
ncbi:hypothetical protein ACWD25_32310 [Streptomyces sp. NPDC002920]